MINLAPDKRQVFAEIMRVSKPGGHVAISDIVTGELPQAVRQGLGAWAACVGGAINEDEYLETMRQVGLSEVQAIARQTYDVASVRGMIDEMASSTSLPPELVEAVCSPDVVSQIWSARESLPASQVNECSGHRSTARRGSLQRFGDCLGRIVAGSAMPIDGPMITHIAQHVPFEARMRDRASRLQIEPHE